MLLVTLISFELGTTQSYKRCVIQAKNISSLCINRYNMKSKGMADDEGDVRKKICEAVDEFVKCLEGIKHNPDLEGCDEKIFNLFSMAIQNAKKDYKKCEAAEANDGETKKENGSNRVSNNVVNEVSFTIVTLAILIFQFFL